MMTAKQPEITEYEKAILASARTGAPRVALMKDLLTEHVRIYPYMQKKYILLDALNYAVMENRGYEALSLAIDEYFAIPAEIRYYMNIKEDTLKALKAMFGDAFSQLHTRVYSAVGDMFECDMLG